MEVTIACPCPDTPHVQDTVRLRDKLDSHRALIINKSIAFIETTDERLRPAEVLATMSEMYLLLGIETWTLRQDGKPIPVTEANIRRFILDDMVIAADVIEAADELYNAAVLLPLVARASRSLPTTPTETSTSPTPLGGQRRRPKPSKPSSITTTPTADTETTSSSLDGVSNSSQSSESAA